ncbi:tripartite tricarboxylate transporter substrate binding protein [Corticibacter populi]|uniref:Tripartite tricarboxylate transporter substrate binding protein n=1 Tax=Corticibacter populi TaxID=1550736 RepID=A0A3M6QPF4_9BURK|nr:tripartite tricarboxylate transporter substrate binding protein [Corticibacter populi]RMX04282.1 tripartite tricarboxylate transporter substrate binding protein [Corticibacter populi]RZS33329.1 tripartite-type tricarboxylate transporter receptor subunit TctC [Corticibacter populi]
MNNYLNRRRMLRALSAGLLATGLAAAAVNTAQAGEFPEKAITFVVPFPPGGPTDAMARTLAAGVGQLLGQSVVVDNRAGAGGNIGASAVARAAPDGYTIMFGTSGPLAINHSLYSKVDYDPRTSFAPIIYVGHLPNILVVRKDLPVDSVQALIALEKAKPGSLNFASSGNGASSHLAGVLFNGMAGTDLQHVPYRGTGPALNDLLAGQVDMSFTDILTAMPYVRSGRVKPLGVATAQRSQVAPELPSIAEQGLPGYDVSVFFGVVAPVGTPPERIGRLNQAFAQVLQSDKVRKSLSDQGLELSTDYRPEYLAGFIASELDKWHAVVEQAGARLD